MHAAAAAVVPPVKPCSAAPAAAAAAAARPSPATLPRAPRTTTARRLRGPPVAGGSLGGWRAPGAPPPLRRRPLLLPQETPPALAALPPPQQQCPSRHEGGRVGRRLACLASASGSGRALARSGWLWMRVGAGHGGDSDACCSAIGRMPLLPPCPASRLCAEVGEGSGFESFKRKLAGAMMPSPLALAAAATTCYLKASGPCVSTGTGSCDIGQAIPSLPFTKTYVFRIRLTPPAAHAIPRPPTGRCCLFSRARAPGLCRGPDLHLNDAPVDQAPIC